MRRFLLCVAAAAMTSFGCRSVARIPSANAPKAEWEKVMAEGSSNSRRRAVQRLAELDKPFSKELVRESVTNDDTFARLAAAEVLADWKEREEAVALLDKLLGDEVFLVRWQAVRSLGETGLESAVGPLTRALSKDPHPMIRAEAARSLGDLGSKGGLPGLVEALKDTDSSVVMAAAEALSRITGEEAVTDYPAWKAYLGGDPAPLKKKAEEAAAIRRENVEYMGAKSRNPFSRVGAVFRRLFTREKK